MKPSSFKESTINLTKPAGMTDEDCSSLPVHQSATQATTITQRATRPVGKLRSDCIGAAR